MNNLKYTMIKNQKQYFEYCNILEKLVSRNDGKLSDEIDLLNILIEKWDSEHNSFDESDPIELIKSLMETNNLKAKDLCEALNLSKGTISKILNYQKGISKETIRSLSDYFKVSQSALNRPYKLAHEKRHQHRSASLKNTKKNLIKSVPRKKHSSGKV